VSFHGVFLLSCGTFDDPLAPPLLRNVFWWLYTKVDMSSQECYSAVPLYPPRTDCRYSNSCSIACYSYSATVTCNSCHCSNSRPQSAPQNDISTYPRS
jgi:hypothetical protein